jgi:hypothetical protein
MRFAEKDAKMKTPSRRKRQQLADAIAMRALAEWEVERVRQVISRARDGAVKASADARATLEELRAKLGAAEDKLRWHEHVVVALADNLTQS